MRAGQGEGPWEAHGILELMSWGPRRIQHLPGLADTGVPCDVYLVSVTKAAFGKKQNIALSRRNPCQHIAQPLTHQLQRCDARLRLNDNSGPQTEAVITQGIRPLLFPTALTRRPAPRPTVPASDPNTGLRSAH